MAVLIHVSIAVASFVLLWRPWIGLCIGLLPLTLAVVTGDADADPVFFVLASATFAFRYGVRPISTVVLLGTGYGGIRNLVAMRGLDGLVGQMLDYTFLTVFGVFLGLAFKGVLAVLERREVRLAILAGDIVEIRSGERLRLAGELRRVVTRSPAPGPWSGCCVRIPWPMAATSRNPSSDRSRYSPARLRPCACKASTWT